MIAFAGTPGLKAVGAFLFVFLLLMLVVVADHLWRNRRRRP